MLICNFIDCVVKLNMQTRVHLREYIPFKRQINTDQSHLPLGTVGGFLVCTLAVALLT